ncbi:hypothetical protein PYK79_17115 [Streptomyces sp. ID05-04B]|uniref:HEAT repeat domain-containing protein n=1 Tax=unclassified Streptomyces TaxID=2593676 RepID=UPI000D1B010A|nr:MULTISPECIES: hypothetical protein [unclassified Streptomyces]AVV43038.1 hypothetical protein C6376_18090 [Streptomyces sp. P3]MDX5564731.1 hypothetical protein [Streptomyces sp. ID05-04B]
MSQDIRGGTAAAALLTAGTPVRDAVAVADPRAWLALDEGARRPDWRTPDGLTYGERVVTPRTDLSPLDEPRLALALCHRDGRTREAALRPAARHAVLLPLVVVRCADWAAPVRERAREVLRERLDAAGALTLAPLILLLARRERGRFAADLLTELLRAGPRGTLTGLRSHPDISVRRFAHRLAVEGKLLSPAELARTAHRDPDNVVQRLCADAALACLAAGGGDHEDVLEPLLTARGPAVRAAGVTALRRAGLPERAVGFLADRAAVVRACARYVVRQHGGDPAAWYREWCAAPTVLAPGAVLGLAECGDRADADVLWPLVRHRDARVRSRAVAGLRMLDADDVQRLWPLLDDPAPGVVREVVAAVLPSAEAVPAPWLTERLGAGWPAHVRWAAFRLLVLRDGDLRRGALLALRDDPDVALRERAAQVAEL